jgi:hypothetical protein
MIKIIDSKSTGKTGRLMLLAKESNGIIVCANPKHYEQKALNYGLVGIDFISYEGYIVNREHYKTRVVFIDEISEFLNCLGYNIKGYTESL